MRASESGPALIKPIWGGGEGKIQHPYLSKDIFLLVNFELKYLVSVMTKAVSNGEIFLKAVLYLCDHTHFSLKHASHGVFCSPPLYIRAKIKRSTSFDVKTKIP